MFIKMFITLSPIPSQNAQSIQFYGELMLDTSLQSLGKASFGFLTQLLSKSGIEDMHVCLDEHAEWRQMVQVPAAFTEAQRNRMVLDVENAPPLDMIPTAIDGRNVSEAVESSLDSFLLHPKAGGKLSGDWKAVTGSLLGSPQGGAGSPQSGRPSLSLVDLIDGG